MLFLTLFTPSLGAMQTETENISSGKYFETALAEINSAKSSIFVAMYLISVNPDQPDSQPNQLVNALAKAKERGVDVKVILDQTIDFQEETRDDVLYANKNQQAFELLKKSKIPVFFDEGETYTHAKAIVIDGETVILGSTNWSKSALTRNNEANALIRSKEFASNLLNDLNQIKLQENIPQTLTPTVSIPKTFLTDKKLLSEMATNADERVLDTYLYLHKAYDGNAERKITLDYDELAKSLGIDQMSKEDYRRQINKVLDKLDQKYRLIKFETPNRNQNTEIILKSDSSENLEIPTTFWRYNWNKTLSFPAKVMYLINLYYSNSSYLSWIMSRDQISKNHDISKSFISDGTQELRRLNLLDIKYGNLEDQQYKERQANAYTPKPLYDPEELKKKLLSLEQQHGEDKLGRAVKAASIVFEENNLQTIQALVNLEDKYGQAVVEEATKKMAEKNPDNPKRNSGYFLSTIKNIATTKGQP